VVVASFRTAMLGLPPAMITSGLSRILERGVAALDHEIPALHVAQLAQTLLQSLQLWCVWDNPRSLEEVTEPVYPSRLLRLGGERRGEKRDATGHERAAVHSMT
jgi:hypothetical protein